MTEPVSIPFARLAEASLWAYDDEAAATGNVQDAWLYDACHFIENPATDTQCFLAVDRKLPPVLAFRGTAGLTDLLIDLRAGKHDWYLPGRVHEGFYESVVSVDHQIDTILRVLTTEQQQQLLICGHSAGGAKATVYAAMRLDRQQPVRAVVTFGECRSLDRTASQWYDQIAQQSGTAHYRFINSADVVPRVPPAMPGWILWLLSHSNPITASLPAIPGGYRHVGKLMYFDHCGELRQQTTRRFRLKDRIQAYIDDFGKPGLASLKMHGSELHYLELVRRAYPVGGVSHQGEVQ